MALAVMATTLVAACGSKTAVHPPATTTTTPPAQTGTVWLCRPGLADDPCTFPISSTVVPAAGARTVTSAAASTHSPYDCFYVYPTVSTQSTDNANLEVQTAETDAAIDQAAPFSQYCQVWAPMYRQRTLAALARNLGPATDDIAYASLLAGWQDYLAHDNNGRPIIFIGHSQGAAMLMRLLANEVDNNPAVRNRTVMAILLGGNVEVPDGKTVGGTFAHLPLCTATGQSGCVIAYSSFPSQPPSTSFFGIPGQGVSSLSGQSGSAGGQVACTNPAALSGGTADLDSEFIASVEPPPAPAPSTLWVTYPDLYSASCQHSAKTTWLEVTTLAAAGRSTVKASLGPNWGYHVNDVNLGMGSLVKDVAAAESSHRPG